MSGIPNAKETEGAEGAEGGEGADMTILDASADLTQSATTDLATIAEMLRYIRDHVAPRITDRDLRHLASRRRARIKIAPHTTLRRATFAAEAAYAAMRRVQECVVAARSLSPATGLSLDLIRSESQIWLAQATEQLNAIRRARQAIAHEISRVQAGVATIVDFPPPDIGGKT